MDLMADMANVMSAVGKRRPDLVQDRNVHLFIDLVLAEAKGYRRRPEGRPPIAPVDAIDV